MTSSLRLLSHLLTSLPINQTPPMWDNESGKRKLLLGHFGMKPHGSNVFSPTEAKILQVIKKLSVATIPRGWVAGGSGATVDVCVEGFALELRHPICTSTPSIVAFIALPLAAAQKGNICIIYLFLKVF